jgi:hypothetical protein
MSTKTIVAGSVVSPATAAVAIAQPAAPAVTDGVKAQRAVGGLGEDAVERQRVENGC